MLSSAMESVRAPKAVGFCLAKKSVVGNRRNSSGLRRYDARTRFPLLFCEEQNNRKTYGMLTSDEVDVLTSVGPLQDGNRDGVEEEDRSAAVDMQRQKGAGQPVGA